MFDIGFWELTVIAVIGLIVLGPERLPVVARALGTWVGRAKGYVRGLTSELEREVNVDDIRSQVRNAREQIESETRGTVSSIRDPLRGDDAGGDSPDSSASGQAKDQAKDQATEVANPVADAARPDSATDPDDRQT